ATAAEARHLARRVDIVQWRSVRFEDARVEVGGQPAQRLARQDREPDRDQRPVGGVEQAMRLGHANEPVAQVGAGNADRHYLGVLGEGFSISRSRPAISYSSAFASSKFAPASSFMRATRSASRRSTMKSVPFSRKARTGGGAPVARRLLRTRSQ